MTTRHKLIALFGAALLGGCATRAEAQVRFASFAARGEVGISDPVSPSRLVQRLTFEFMTGPNSNGIDPLKEDLFLQVTHPTPCYDVYIPAGSFVATQNGFVVADASRVQVMLVFPNQPIVDLTQEIADLRIRLTTDGARWRLRWEARFESNEPQPCFLPLMSAAEQIGLRVNDDAGRLVVSRIDFAGATP